MKKKPRTRREPPGPDALEVAIRLHRGGQLDQARAIYERILARVPDHADALHFLGMLSHQQGRSEEGLDLIRKAVGLAPSYAAALNNLGNILKLLGRLDEAADAYRRALALMPDAADTHNNLALVLKESNRLEEALAALQRAVELQPNHPEAHHNMGNVLSRMKRFEEAVVAYRRATGIRPIAGGSYRRLGAVLGALGRKDEALAVYRTWVEKEPDDALARHMLAACAGTDVPARTADDAVRQLFDSFSDGFDNALEGLQYRAPLLVQDAILSAVGAPAGSMDVLDAGCGTGLCAEGLRPYARALVGVDLSTGMLRKAAARKTYDELIAGELTERLSAWGDRFDLIASADTLCYFGVLEDVLRASAGALRAGGVLVFTVEAASDADAPQGFVLRPHGRYAHTGSYVRACLQSAGLEPTVVAAGHLRLELLVPVDGWVVTARKPATATPA